MCFEVLELMFCKVCGMTWQALTVLLHLARASEGVFPWLLGVGPDCYAFEIQSVVLGDILLAHLYKRTNNNKARRSRLSILLLQGTRDIK